MGLKVSAAEAARLAHRSERAVRQWIASGKVPAQPSGIRERRPGVGPTRWLIDVEELARLPGVVIDRAYLAELEIRAAQAEIGPGLAARVEQLEAAVAELREEIEHLCRGQPGETRS